MQGWINSNTGLQQLCDQLIKIPTLAVDTEFIRTDTFFPKIALIQLSDGENCWLIDVLAIDQFAPLKSLLESPQVTLIFHACAEDLEVLDCALKIQPRNIFDTQVAAGLTNVGYNMGYAKLVQKFYDIELDKQETRSDWLARPLSPQQLKYAQIDVAYLHGLHKHLSRSLSEHQREVWFAEEMQGLYDLVEKRKQSVDYYLRIKNAWRLNAKSISVLKHLCCWREDLARAKDKPRSRIVKDAVLYELARQIPQDKHQLHRIEDWHPHSIKRYGDTVLKEIKIVDYQAGIEMLPPPLTREMSAVFKRIRHSLSHLADENNIPAEFLCNKKELEQVLRSSAESECNWPARLNSGWRSHWVKPAIEAELVAAKLV